MKQNYFSESIICFVNGTFTAFYGVRHFTPLPPPKAHLNGITAINIRRILRALRTIPFPYYTLYFLSFLLWPLLPYQCKCRGIFLHLTTLKDTHIHTHTHTHTHIHTHTHTHTRCDHTVFAGQASRKLCPFCYEFMCCYEISLKET